MNSDEQKQNEREFVMEYHYEEWRNLHPYHRPFLCLMIHWSKHGTIVRTIKRAQEAE